MRNRGQNYWNWADPTLHTRSHDEELGDGTTIDVQVRLSPAGMTQLFIGVYATAGMALHEEAIDCRRNESMTRVLAWGSERLAVWLSRAFQWLSNCPGRRDVVLL